MKTCPHCANEIQDDLEVCPYCNNQIESSSKKNFYSLGGFGIGAMVVAGVIFLLFNPRLSYYPELTGLVEIAKYAFLAGGAAAVIGILIGIFIK